MVLTNQVLWSVAMKKPGTLDDLIEDGMLAPWQVDEFGRELLAVVRDG
jgi:hypothetical protein